MASITLAFFSMLIISCASTRQVSKEFTSNDLRSIASEEVQSLPQLTKRQLLAYSGKNILRVVVSCPVSAMSIVASAVAETIPNLSAAAGMATELYSYDGYRAEFEWTDKPKSTGFGGSVVGLVKDLTTLGYSLIFDNNTSFENVFKDTKTSYDGTAYLAKRFYSEKGNCGLAGQQLSDTLKEVQSRKSK